MDDQDDAARGAVPDLVTAPAPIDPRDVPTAGIPTPDRGIGAPTPSEPAVPLRGGSLAEQIDGLHADMLGGTALGNHTELWNLVHAFKERVKALVAAIERAA